MGIIIVEIFVEVFQGIVVVVIEEIIEVVVVEAKEDVATAGLRLAPLGGGEEPALVELPQDGHQQRGE